MHTLHKKVAVHFSIGHQTQMIQYFAGSLNKEKRFVHADWNAIKLRSLQRQGSVDIDIPRQGGRYRTYIFSNPGNCDVASGSLITSIIVDATHHLRMQN